jgi:DNA-binding GntR family transcriptional regulator
VLQGKQTKQTGQATLIIETEQDVEAGHAGDDKAVPPRERQRPSARVEAELRRRLTAGEWAQDEALPTVAELAQQYATSGATVSKVLRKLADEGLVEVIPRWGTFRR